MLQHCGPEHLDERADPRKRRNAEVTAWLSLALLALGVVGWLSDCSMARDVGFVLYAVIGFGSAIPYAIPSNRQYAASLSVPAGLAFSILVGFSLVETGAWWAAKSAFVVAVSISSLAHASVLLGTKQRRTEERVLRQDEPAAARHARRVEKEGIRQQLRDPAGAAICSLTGLACCLLCAGLLYDFNPSSPAAFLGSVSPAWYFGAVLVAVGVVWGLASGEGAAVIPVTTLSLVVTLSIALAYGEPHSAWAAQHVGVTLYVLAHGSVNPQVDIYQAWPGLFAGVAWVCKSIGVQDVMEVARWWPPVMDLGAMCVFQGLAFVALGSKKRAWLATALFVMGNTIGQDYYSPQAAGYVLALGMFLLMYTSSGQRGLTAAEWLVFSGLAVAVAVTHPLSPFMIVGAMTILAIGGRSRSRLAPVMVLFPATAWAAANFGAARQYLSFQEIGSVFKNLLPQGFVSPSLHKSALINFNSGAMAADALIIGVLAVLVIGQYRNRDAVVLALCAASGLGLFVANSYGNEGVFRVVLFALPWLAILAAAWRANHVNSLGIPALVSLVPLFGLYLFANFSLDYMRTVRVGDVQAMQTFERVAPKESRLFVLGYSFAPIMSSGDYSEFSYVYYPDVAVGAKGVKFNALTSYEEFMRATVPDSLSALRRRPVFVLAAEQPAAAMSEVNLATIVEYWKLSAEFAASRDWTVVTRTGSAELFELRPGVYVAGQGS
jgi:hypothetical protein